MSFNAFLPSRLKRSLRSFKRLASSLSFSALRSWKFNDKNLRSRRSSRILRSSFKAINSGSFAIRSICFSFNASTSLRALLVSE